MPNARSIASSELNDLYNFLMCYYSHRPTDINEVVAIVVEEASAGKLAADVSLIAAVRRLLFEGRDEAYFDIRSLALEVLRSPDRFKTTSTSEGLALALLFDRKDWLGDDTWAYAAKRVGRDWLNAIVQVEQDFKWMKLPIKSGSQKEGS